MGNSDSKAERKSVDKEDNSFVSRTEIASLRNIYHVISLNMTLQTVSYVFGSSEQELFSECIFHWMQKHVKDYKTFEKLIIDLTRMESTRCLKTVWNMLLNHPKVTNQNKIQMFFILTVIVAFPEGCNSIITTSEEEDSSTAANGDDDDAPNNSLENIVVAAKRLTEFYNNSMLKVNPSFDLTSRNVGYDESDTSPAARNSHFTCLSGWINNYAPYIGKVFESYVSLVCFKGALSPSFHPFVHPALKSSMKLTTSRSIVNECDVLPLGLFNVNLQDEWSRLYNTAMDGTSFNRVVHHILGYEGPTCIIIKCRDEEGTILGCYSATRWKENNGFYGSSSNLLFTLKPKIRIYRSKSPSNQAYQYLNMKSYSNPHGLAMGGTLDGFRFFIPETLEHCIAGQTCPTYEPGRLIVGDKFEIDTIEIWGCGGTEKVKNALQAQVKEREIVDESIRKARKCDKAAFFNNAFDREFLLGGTFAHQGQTSGRG